MTLLSKKDHDMVIKALDFYIVQKENKLSYEELYLFNDLLSWVKVKSSEVI